LRVAERGQVGAGAEVAAGAGEHRHADAVVVLEFLEGGAQRVGGGAVYGVALVRPVDGNGADRAVGFGDDQGSGHGVLLLCAMRRCYSLWTRSITYTAPFVYARAAITQA
jgi:hypothetical protein